MTWIHWATFAAGLIFLFMPEGRIPFTALLLFPLIGLILYTLKGSQASDTEVPNGKGLGIGPLDYALIAGIIMAIVSLNNYFVLDYKKILLPFAMATGVLVAAVLFFRKKQASNPTPQGRTYLIIIVSITMYCFGAVVGINSMYDQSSGVAVDVTVGSKAYVRKWYDDAGEGAHVIKTILPDHRDSTTIEIPMALYLKVNRGDVISIVHRQGLLRIPWYRVEKAKDSDR